MAQVEAWRKAEWTRTAGEGREWMLQLMGLIGVFQVGTRMFFKGYFFSKNFREDSRLVVRKWKELKS